MSAASTSWASALHTPRVLWAAMLAGTFVYGGILVAGVLPPAEPDETLRWAFAAVAFAAAVASFVVPAAMRRAMRLEAETEERVDPGGQSMFRDAAPTQKVATDPAAVRSRYVARRQTALVLGLALAEVPAIFGLLSSFIAGVPLAGCLVLVALGAASILVRYPATRRWRADAEARLGALIPDAQSGS